MFTRLTQFSSVAVLGLATLGGMDRSAAQDPPPNPGFRINQGQPVGPVGGVRPGGPAAGGFSYTGPGLPAGSYGMITSSPLSGITSSPYGPDGVNPAYGYGNYILPDPYGGYLKGVADVVSATGKFGIQSQQAYLLKEQVRAAQMDNRRRLFDEWLYERANTPSLQDELERIQKQELRRSRFDPPKTEIWSAKALNDVLEDLKRIDRNKAPGGNSPVDEDVLRRINVTSGKGNINLGVLKNDGKLDWALALRDPSLGEEGRELRQQIQSLVSRAYEDAKAARQPDPGTIKEIRESTRKLEDQLRRHVNELGYSQYTEAKAYLGQLREGINLLQDKNAADYINGKYSLANLKGNSVADVVKYMQENGLQFAPAVDGEQAAYIALHRALANYDIAAGSMVAQQP